MSKGALATQQGGQAPAKANALQSFLQGQRDRIADVLPKDLGLTPEKVIKLACLTVHRKPELQSCSQVSILSAVLEASSLGLEIGGPLAEAHLVPFKGECTFMPDYKGLLKLARRSGEFDAIEGVEVFANDVFRVYRNPIPTIQHELCLDGDRGAIKWVYAYAVLKGGQLVFEVMSRSQVEEIRSKSVSKDSPAWRNWWGQMAVKCVLKRLLKRQARSVSVAKAVAADDREYVVDASYSHQGTSRRGVAGVRSSLGLDAPSPPQGPLPAAEDVDTPATTDFAHDEDEARWSELAGEG